MRHAAAVLAAAALALLAGPVAATGCVDLGLPSPKGDHYESLEGNDYRALFCGGQLRRVFGRIYGETYRDEETFTYAGGVLVAVRVRHLRYRSTFGPVGSSATKAFFFRAGRLARQVPPPPPPGPNGDATHEWSDYLDAGRELARAAEVVAAKCLRPGGARRGDSELAADCAAPK